MATVRCVAGIYEVKGDERIMTWQEAAEVERDHKLIQDELGDRYWIVGHHRRCSADNPVFFYIKKKVLGVPREPIEADPTTVLCMEVVE